MRLHDTPPVEKAEKALHDPDFSAGERCVAATARRRGGGRAIGRALPALRLGGHGDGNEVPRPAEVSPAPELIESGRHRRRTRRREAGLAECLRPGEKTPLDKKPGQAGRAMSHPDPVHVSDALSAFPYPGTERELLRFVQRTGADQSVVRAIAALPTGVYGNSAEVMRTIIDRLRPG